MAGDDAGGAFWANYDNAFTRWLGWQQGDRTPDFYEAVELDAGIGELLSALPDTDLGSGDKDIIIQLLAGENVSLDDEAHLSTLQGVADSLPADGVEAAFTSATQAGEAYAANLEAGVNPFMWFFTNLLEAFYNISFAVTHPGSFLDWMSWGGTDEDKISLMRFIYYGASKELFFVFLALTMIVVGCGMVYNRFLWGIVRGLEGFANAVGRTAAWAGLLMVLQQILIIFMQRVFAVSEISLGFGMGFSFPVSWWAEELKLYNAMIVTLCIAYTFVQGGHVRVDLIYSVVSFRVKRVIDMFGSLFLMIPAATLIWMYSWFFMWRHLINPPVSASDSLERLITAKYRGMRWSVETIGFSPNGFNAYFLFKVLLVFYIFMIFLQAIAFFCRSFLEWKEGPESEGKYLDKDDLADEVAELAANIH